MMICMQQRLLAWSFIPFKLAIIYFLSSSRLAFAQAEPDVSLMIGYSSIFLGVMLIYSIPIFVAFYRKHPNRWPIFIITVIFGATGLGWLVAMVWAMSATHISPTGNHGGESGLNLFVNDPQNGVVKSNGPQQQPLEDNHASFPENMKSTDVLVKLEKLQTLRKSGTVNETEFIALKSRLIKDAC